MTPEPKTPGHPATGAPTGWKPADIIRAGVLAVLLVIFAVFIFLSTRGVEYGALAEALAKTTEVLLVLAVGFYFGSSQGSKDKDDRFPVDYGTGYGTEAGYRTQSNCPNCGYPLASEDWTEPAEPDPRWVRATPEGESE